MAEIQKELNKELEVLVEKANEKLANGEENIEVSSGDLKLGFNSVPDIQRYSVSPAASKIGSKSYQAFITNTKGFNFSHAVSGVFSWNGKKLSAVSARESLSGKLYSKSANTTKEGLDGTIGRTAKVARVTSKGVFTYLKYAFSYHTTIIVDVYAPTKSYRIVKAQINT